MDAELPAGGALRRARAPRPELRELAPRGVRRMGANPHANGGTLVQDLALPDFRDYGVAVDSPATKWHEPTRVLGEMLRDVLRLNQEDRNFRIFGPDETASNRLSAVFEATDRVSTAEILPTDDHISPDGRVMEVLSEHMCQGWLEGYLLTGPPRLLLLLRGVHPHRRLDVQPARQVAEGHAPDPLAPPHRVAQLPAHFARLAAGPQRVLASGSRVHRPRHEQEGGDRARLPAA